MTNWCLILALMLLAVGQCRGQAKGDFVLEEGSPEALLVERINGESRWAEKLALLEQFEASFPRHEALGWVHETMLACHTELQGTDGLERSARKVLERDPRHVSAALSLLRVAEARQDVEGVREWSGKAAAIAHAAAELNALPGETPEERTRRVEHARDVEGYAEYALFNVTRSRPDARERVRMIDEFEQEYPQSRYLGFLLTQRFIALRTSGQTGEAVRMAEATIQTGQPTEEMLLIAANHYYQRDNAKVLRYAGQMVQMLSGKARPGYLSEEQWGKQQRALLGHGHWLMGITHSGQESYGLADKHLRVAVGLVRGEEQMLAAALFHLGYANFRLAETGTDKTRVLDAIRYTEQCLQIKSSLQLPAMRNLESMRIKYNLQ